MAGPVPPGQLWLRWTKSRSEPRSRRAGRAVQLGPLVGTRGSERAHKLPPETSRPEVRFGPHRETKSSDKNALLNRLSELFSVSRPFGSRPSRAMIGREEEDVRFMVQRLQGAWSSGAEVSTRPLRLDNQTIFES